jgi:large repetitive protein
MKIVKIASVALAVAALILAGPANIGFALVKDGDGGGGGGGGGGGTPVTHTVIFSSNNTSWGDVSAAVGAQALTSPTIITDGGSITVTALPVSGVGEYVGTSGTCGSGVPGNIYETTFVITADCAILVTFQASAPVLPDPPTAGTTYVVVKQNSSNNPITLNLGGGVPDAVTSTTPAHGTVTPSGATLTYTPATNYVGTDSFNYSASNADGESSMATVFVTVEPVFVTFSASYGDTDGKTVAADGTPLVVITMTNTTTQAILSNGDSVQSGQHVQLRWTIASGYETTLVSVAPGLAMSPFIQDLKMTGVDFVADSNVGSGFTVFVRVQPESEPTVSATTAVLASNSDSNSIPLLVGGPAATSINAGPAAHGTVTVVGQSAIYTPAPGYSGQDSFTYTATNGAGTSDEATVSVTVTPPVITLSSRSVEAGDPLVVGGTGFAPNESVTIVLHSTPVTLGTFHADAAGVFNASIAIPKGTAAGSHNLYFNAATSGTTSKPLTVRVAGSAIMLANTGFDSPGGILGEVSLAGFLALVGVFFVVANRRRQRRELALE